MSSRSPAERVLGPRRRTSASSVIGLAVSGRNAIGPKIPGSPAGSCICGIKTPLSIRIEILVEQQPVRRARSWETRDCLVSPTEFRSDRLEEYGEREDDKRTKAGHHAEERGHYDKPPGLRLSRARRHGPLSLSGGRKQ